MKKIVGYSLVVLVFLAGAAYLLVNQLTGDMFPEQTSVTLAGESACDAAALPALEDLRLISVSLESQPVDHCKIAGVIEKEINFELLLPLQWNGKFVMGGGGGFVGSVVNMAFYYGALQSGYATVGTDTGHRGHPVDASWALDRPDRVENFGHRAVHLTTVRSKEYIAAFYGQESRLNYFMGCSRGGGQALMEAQRYPQDYDGIVAGAPAFSWHQGIGVNGTRINQAQFPDPESLEQAVVTPADQALIREAYLAQCDGLDGIEDGILNDPRACPFQVSSLQCKGVDSSSCLSEEKVNAMEVIYNGPIVDGERVWPGFPLGGETSEQGMTQWLTGGLDYAQMEGNPIEEVEFEAPVIPNAVYGFANGVMKYLVFNDADWDYSSYDFSSWEEDTAEAARILSADDPDLDAFRARGGKMLMYHGWSDMALSANGSIQYYEQVLERDAAARDDVRLYLMPGVDHCFGGEGPFWVNYLTEIDRWVESGQPPEAIEARWLQWFILPRGSRPVCPYPQQAKYNGSGDTRDAASFSCTNP